MIKEIEEKIEEFKLLDYGWLGPEGIPFKNTVLEISKELSEFCEAIGFKEQEIFPGTESDVNLCLYGDKVKRVEIEIYISENLHYDLFCIEHLNNYINELELETDDFNVLKEHIQKIKEYYDDNNPC